MVVTAQPIRFVDLARQHADLAPHLTAACADVLARGDFILGEAVGRFESAFAHYCGTTDAVGCGSGLDALTLILQAAGIGAGDEVITQANSFIATAYSISRCGARPVLVDCRDDDLSIDLEQCAAAIGPRTKAIIPVHLYGRLADMDRVRGLASRHGLAVFEDAAQSHGAAAGPAAALQGRAGSLSDAASFSFYPAKNLGCAGDGGVATTSNKDIAQGIRLARNYGQLERYHHADPNGTNSRLDTLQAAILQVKLPHLDRWNEARRQAAEWYDERLDHPAIRPPPLPVARESHVWHLYPVRLEAADPCRDHVRDRLQAAGIETGIHYPLPIHLQEAFAWLGHQPGDFPVAEAAARRLISLPMHPYLSESDIDRVAEALIDCMAVPHPEAA